MSTGVHRAGLYGRAASRPDYSARADALFLDNLARYLAGRPLRNVVDKAEGY